jgi:nitrogen fixation/metabolism regulation signal transduction histidine kinase
MRPRLSSGLPVALLCVVMLGSLAMLSEAMQDSARFGRIYLPLLVVNALGLVAFVVLIGVNWVRLARQLRARQPGSRLTLRLVTLFTALAVTPVVVLFGFSLHYLRQGIDSWFDVQIAEALSDSLELSRAALDIRMRELLARSRQMAAELADGSAPSTPLDLQALRAPGSIIVANTPGVSPVDLDALRARGGAHEVLLLTGNGNLIASSNIDNTQVVPNLPSDPILLQVQQGRSYIGLDPIEEQGLYVRVVVGVPGGGDQRATQVLQALYPIASRLNDLAGGVEAAVVKYNELVYLRKQLKISFTMSLTLVLLFSVLSAMWAAFHAARRLVAPVRDLAEGTDQVARGNYETTLPVTSQDEIGFLVQSFNEMTRRIAAARDEARRSRDEVDTQRAYLAAVLSRLSSGVLTVDGEMRIHTSNPSAAQILGLAPDSMIGMRLAELAAAHPPLTPLIDAIRAHLDSADDWQVEVLLFGVAGRQVLMCRGTTLAGGMAREAGHVIVFDDITTLMQAQRNAAWGEAARRLAHEIKNPLTPIQLSAERLRLKYLNAMKPDEAEVLDRLTHTIVQQVETMKGMVNAFSDYARPPKMQQQETDVRNLVDEVADLFRGVRTGARIRVDSPAEVPFLYADPGRLRQVLNNVVKNAIEATPEDRPPDISIRIRAVQEHASRYVEIAVEDNGIGVDPALLGNLFDPYVTSKPKGTGLGLAIVKKIVEEHGGVVWIENKPNGGACVIIRFPVQNRAGDGARTLQRDAV